MGSARRRHAATLALLMMSLALAPVVPAQSRVESVLRAEEQRMDAVRGGRDVARFYDPAYRGITPLGQYQTIEQIRALAAKPGSTRLGDVVVEVRDDTAIVTALEGTSDADSELALRIWTRHGGAWTIATAQSTWVGSRSNVP